MRARTSASQARASMPLSLQCVPLFQPVAAVNRLGLAQHRAIINPNIGLGKSFALALLTIASAIDFPITITAAMLPPAIKITTLGLERRRHNDRHGLNKVPAPGSTLSGCNKRHETAYCTRG